MDTRNNLYPLTYPQKGIWHLEKLHPNTSIGIIAATLKINSKLDYAALKMAINHFIKVNDALRIRIRENDDREPEQYVSDFEYRDLPFFDFSSDIKELYEWDSKMTRTPIYKPDSDLFYFALIKINENSGGFFVKLHHLIGDAWTLVNLGNEIMSYYKSIISGEELINSIKPSYIDYIISEQKYLNSERFIKDQAFWLDKFSTIPELTLLKEKKHARNSIKANRKTFLLPAKLCKKIREHCIEYKTSIFSLFLGAMAIYINRTKGDNEVVFGTPVLNRSNAKEKDTMGMFISTIPIHINVDDNLDYISFSESINQEWMSVLRHQKYPYMLLLKKLREKNPGLEKLYDIVISYQNAKFMKEDKNSQEGRWHQNGCQTDSLSIHINDREDDGNIVVDYDYLSDLFYSKEIEFLHDHLIRLLWHAIDNPTKKLSSIEMISEKEMNKLLFEFNNTKKEYPNKTLQQLFEEQVQKTPDKIALVFNKHNMTYQELNERANQLARELRKNNVKQNDVIGIMVSRSFDLIIGILGVLKAGGAYLPVDPEYPKERIEYMLEDSKAQVLLVEKKHAKTINFKGKKILITDNSIYKNNDGSNIVSIGSPSDLAYVIYTSGSTGKPKGVMIENKSVVNFIYGVTDIINFNDQTILSVTTVSFDIFVLESILPLICGAKAVIANEREQKIPRLLSEAILSNGVTMLQTTPSRIQMILNDDSSYVALSKLNVLMVGGEALPPTMFSKIKKIVTGKIYNMYGPTETTVWSTIKDLTNATTVDIGKPTRNTKILILDKHMNLVPIGVVGELYIGGAGLARGYINKDELTKERFIPNPFAKGEKIYKTGDLARWYPKGDIECLGRIDHQIKLRGFRIELGEIENRILSYPSIKEAAVIDRINDAGEKYLCAFYVAEEKILASEIKKHLEKELPYFMVPSYFMQLEKIPLTPNGKINRNLLPEIKKEQITKDNYKEPQTETEIILAQIWEEVLCHNMIGRESNFFELGGDSLNIITLMNKIHKRLHVELSFEELSQIPTIKEMADYIDNTKKRIYTSIQKTEEREYYPISSAQRRIYILVSMEENNIGYNMPFALLIEGKPDKKKIETAFCRLIDRHESLRTSFALVNNEPVQIVHKDVDFSVIYENCSEDGINDFLMKNIKPFDLSHAPLLRVAIAVLSSDKYIMFIDMHHIISDGISINILLDEFASLYDGNLLPDMSVQYKDYVIWKNQMDISYQEEYWLQQFNGEIPVLELPYDYERPHVQSYKGSKLFFSIGKELSEKINKFRIEKGVTAFNLLMSAYYILLSKYSGHEDITVGTPVAGRNHLDIEKMVGFFVNTLALRGNPAGEKTVIDFIYEVRDNIYKAFENQDYPFEELVNKLKLHRNLSRNPLFDTMLIYQRMDKTKIECNDITITQYDFDSCISKFDLTLEVTEKEDELFFTIEYGTDLFSSETIKRMGQHYINILDEIVSNFRLRISDIEMLSPEEKQMLLYTFNDTAVEYEKNKTIQQFIQEQAEKTPDAIAVIFEDKPYTYRQLNTFSNKIAWYLRHKNIKPNEIVGIMVSRSFEMIAAIIGVLKSGGCYLPIDPDYPEERIKYILDDSGAKYVITQKEWKRKVLSDQEHIDINDNTINGFPQDNPVNINTGEDLAYVIYTSGSTGNPKGVMIRHNSLINFINGVMNKIDFCSKKSIICITTICFDIFVLESILPLSIGMKVILANQEEAKNPSLLKALIKKYGVNMLQTTPSRLKLFLNQDDFITCLSDLSEIMIGGEPLPFQLLKKLEKLNNTKIYNMYGPTETTVWSTIKLINNCKKITIGYPIDNTQIYILDRYMKLLPLGVKGDLYIGGEGLSKGYLSNEDLTRERFIKNPITGYGIIYKTGDIAKWLPDGDIELFGRNDHQVKILGYRIEIEEIEKKLMEIPNIKHAVVIDFVMDDNKYLCGYYVVNKGNRISEKRIKESLQKTLPDYMIPSKLIMIESIPLTPNGKVDRHRLPDPTKIFQKNTNSKFKRPDAIEEELIEVWRKVLNRYDITVTDNFFEIGGDSLSVIQVQLELFKKNFKISTQDFYRYQSIRKLSQHLIKSTENSIYYISNSSDTNDLNEKFSKLLVLNKNKTEEYDRHKSLLITGSTGYLGAHILKEFLIHDDMDIYCIVRPDKEHNAENYLINVINGYFSSTLHPLPLNRLHIVCGDITKKNFGLSEEEYNELGRKIGVVIHSAANVKHYGDYNDFYETNVKGTEIVANFCFENGIYLFHISTISISGDYLKKCDNIYSEEFTEKNFYVGQNYNDNVYIRSKFEAEKVIYDKMVTGLSASVFRVGNLTARFSDGCFQRNPHTNAFYNRIKAMLMLKFIPETILDMELEFTPVDCCSDAIYRIMRSPARKEIVYHLFNHNTITISNFIQLLSNFGIYIETVSQNEFERRIQELKNQDKDIIMGLYEYINNNNILTMAKKTTISSEQTQRTLSEFNFNWPLIDAQYLYKFINQIEKGKIL